MEPISSGSAGPMQNTGSAGGAGDNGDAEFAAQFDKVMMSMAQGLMSVMMEEMQQMATSEDE